MSDIEELIKLEPYKSCYEYGELKGRADKLSEICKQISERVKYWDICAKAMEKGSNEYKIFISLAKNFDELLEHINCDSCDDRREK